MNSKYLAIIVGIILIGYAMIILVVVACGHQHKCAIDSGNNRQDVHECQWQERKTDGNYLLYCVDMKGYVRPVTIPKNVCTLKAMLLK